MTILHILVLLMIGFLHEHGYGFGEFSYSVSMLFMRVFSAMVEKNVSTKSYV